MQFFRVKGGKALSGEVKVSGSKNAALPIICASVLTKEKCVIKNIPDIQDVHTLLHILKFLGSEYTFENNVLTIQTKEVKTKTIPHDLVKCLRASILLLSPILIRNNKVKLSYPGGCVLGKRPIDSHLYGYMRLGAKVTETNDYIQIKSPKGLAGADITMPEISVTGTENIIVAACASKGKTIIRLAASEPHVQDLCHMLNEMGAKIRGIGTHTLHIEGVSVFKGVKSHSVTPDYLEAGTLAISAAITRGNVKIKNMHPHDLEVLWQKFEEVGIPFEVGKNWVHIKPTHKRYKPVHKLQTLIFPGFPTDLQAPFAVLLTQAHGVSRIFETLFEGRLGYLFELEKMGAKTEILNPNQALIIGPTKLQGVPIASCDLRAGAAMVIAALVAKGETIISNINYIDRGYENFEQKLRSLGADIERFDS